MVTTATLMKEIETLPQEYTAEAFDFIVFLKTKEKPRRCEVSLMPLKSAYGIFKGINTDFERDEEDRI